MESGGGGGGSKGGRREEGVKQRMDVEGGEGWKGN